MIPRNKTRRATTPIVDPPSPTPEVKEESIPLYGQNSGLEEFLSLDAGEAYKRPWHRLERGLRLNRMRNFINQEKLRMTLSDADTIHLTSVLHKALEKKILNSKTYVIYDQEHQEIKEIKGLVYHKTADGRILSNLVEKKSGGVTFRKKPTRTSDTPTDS